MAYMRLHAPELGIDRKRAVAQALTGLVLTSSPGLAPERCTVQFVPYHLDDVAVGGVLVFDSNEPQYTLEVFAPETHLRQKDLARDLGDLLARLLGCGPDSVHVRLAAEGQRGAA